MNRGSAAVRLDAGRAHAGFNEAPIHESGKCLKLLSGFVLVFLLQ